MIYLPLKTVIEKYLRPHGLPDELVREIACPRYQGPGETNPFFEKSIVEGFVQERRPAPAAVRSYLNEEDKNMIVASDRVREIGGPLLKMKQAAQYLAIGERQLQYEVAESNISCVRMGKHCIRFAQEDLDEYVNRHRSPSRAVGEG